MSSPKKALLEEFFISLFKAHAHITNISRQLVEQQGISFPCWRILSTIKIYNDSRITIPVLAERLTISRQAVQRQIQILVADGLIEPIENPNNKRSCYFQLTQKGQQTCDHMVEKVYSPWSEIHFKDFDETMLSTTLEIFKKLSKL